MRFIARFALGCVVAVTALHAYATDGVIEINQAKIDAAGGGTYVLGQPGSYRLTSNLLQPDKDTDVIKVQANDVTLDLNGFTIRGNNVCTYAVSSVTCSRPGGGMGINADGSDNLTIRNGNIRGLGSTCIHNGTNAHSRLHDIAVSHCGSWGVLFDSGAGGSLSRVIASYNGATGIEVAGAAEIADSEANFNGADGIHQAYGNIRHSIAGGNIGYGIWLSGTLIGSTIASNGKEGLALGPYGSLTYSGNLIEGNNNKGAQLKTSGQFLLNGGGNICSNAACP